MSAENIVYVGKKNTMAYVLAVVTKMNAGASEVTIKARGNAISTAVDAAEIVRNRFLKDAKIKSITTSTEQVTSEKTQELTNVSSIEILMIK